MIPPEADVSRLMLQIEANVHRLGWDAPPILAAVNGVRPGVLRLRPLPVPIQNPPGEFLLWMADMLRTDAAVRAIATDLARPRFAGMAFVTEGWSNDTLTPEQYEALGRSLADVPGSKEIRVVNIVDVGGRYHAVSRLRGEKPLYMVSGDGRLQVTTGRVVEALHSMVLTVAEMMDPADADVAALKAHPPSTVEQVQAARAARAAAEREG